MESITLCSQCGLNLKESKKYRVYSYWKAYCIDQEWQLYVCNSCREKPLDIPCDQSQIKWQKIENSFFIKH